MYVQGSNLRVITENFIMEPILTSVAALTLAPLFRSISDTCLASDLSLAARCNGASRFCTKNVASLNYHSYFQRLSCYTVRDFLIYRVDDFLVSIETLKHITLPLRYLCHHWPMRYLSQTKTTALLDRENALASHYKDDVVVM